MAPGEDFVLEVSQAHIIELDATTSFGSLLTAVKLRVAAYLSEAAA
ncbi:MAG: hypothetical protein KY458_02095 [Actinobacteria bacterium]|nr:hypothetical protein [Actinomycetota bacterium]